MQVRDLAAYDVRAFAFVSPSESRGRRESRVRAAPAVSRAICAKETAHEHTGPAEAIRLSLRSGLRLTSCSPR